MNTKILSGLEASNHAYDKLNDRIKRLKTLNVTPSLAVLLVGDNPASRVYVKNKSKKFFELGINSETFLIPDSISENDLLAKINIINKNDDFHGILVQLPLPKHIDSNIVIKAIDQLKDVDGFHPYNLGSLVTGNPIFTPCTPKGVMRILQYYKINLSGKHVTIIGRSNIVGRPMSILTSLKEKFSNATTTICHSGSDDIFSFTKISDVIILAIGKPQFLKSDHIKNGAVIIDVGINRLRDNSIKGYKIVGDADELSLMGRASAITPVPGGVGPMTIAMLIENTIEAAERTLNEL